MSEQIFERMRNATANRVKRTDDKVAATLKGPLAPKKAVGDVGLELEIEGQKLPRFIDYLSPETAVSWYADKDGSLRGESLEYITNGPIKVAEVKPMVKALFDTFTENETKLALSNRCSTHVHVNCSTLTAKPITSLIALYAIVEEAVTHWCGEERISNPFCLRMIDTTSTLENWQSYLEDANNRRHRGDGAFDRGDKYNALNLRPLLEQGSVEFRALRGADDPDTVVKWVNFLWALREEARTTYRNPETLAQQVSAMGVGGVIQGIVEKYELGVFWNEVVEHPLNEGQIDKMLRRGFLLVQPLLFSVNWMVVEDREEIGEAVEDHYARQEKLARIAQHEAQKARNRPAPQAMPQDDMQAVAEEAPRRAARPRRAAAAEAPVVGWAEPLQPFQNRLPPFQNEALQAVAVEANNDPIF